MASQRLFKPLKIGTFTLENRVAMAPLTRLRADSDHVPSKLAAEYYAQRSSAKGTLIITEATFISPRSGGYRNAPGIWSEEQIKGWKAITDAVHEKGSFIFMQLWALGRVADPAVLAEEGFEVQSSGNISYHPEKVAPIPLTKDEIKMYVKDYAQAARNAIEAGFDGVEIHGANGYLVDQFWQDVSNNRTDEYGGSIENRARFGLEVTKAVIDAVGDSKKVGMRLSPFGSFQAMKMDDPIPQFSYIVEELRKFDLAYLSLIESREGGGSSADAEYEDRTKENAPLVQIWGKDLPVIFAGGFDLAKANRVVDQYYSDFQALIAFGRHFISTPDLVSRLQKGVELNKWDRTTFYGGGPIGYIDYPFAGNL